MTKTNLFITGGTGFIGSHLLPFLAGNDKYNITVLTRDHALSDIAGQSVNIIHGNLNDQYTYEDALNSTDAVIHLAGILNDNHATDNMCRAVNVEGTRSLMEACKGKNIRKFIHCSSTAVYGDKGQTKPRSETSPANPESVYGITKLEAEQILLKGFEPDEISLVIIRPSGIYGPGDMKGLKYFRAIKHDRIRFYINTTQIVHPTHVMDVVHAIGLILEKDLLHHEILNIGGEKSLRLIELATMTAKLMGTRIIQIGLPEALLPACGYVTEKFCRLTGKKNNYADKFTLEIVDHSIVTSKAKDLLGYAPVSFQDGMKETIDWYIENRYI